MKRILISCTGGFSSSSLARSVYKHALSLGIDTEFVPIMSEFDFRKMLTLKNDLIISFMSIYYSYGFDVNNIDKSRTEDFDAILIGPQCRYLYNNVKEEAKKIGKPFPCEVIPAKTYGMIDGAKCFEHALKIMNLNIEDIKTQ